MGQVGRRCVGDSRCSGLVARRDAGLVGFVAGAAEFEVRSARRRSGRGTTALCDRQNSRCGARRLPVRCVCPKCYGRHMFSQPVMIVLVLKLVGGEPTDTLVHH